MSLCGIVIFDSFQGVAAIDNPIQAADQNRDECGHRPEEKCRRCSLRDDSGKFIDDKSVNRHFNAPQTASATSIT
jgi:hypothetical protein